MKNLLQYRHWYVITISLLVTVLESIPRIATLFLDAPFRPKLFGPEVHPGFSVFFLTADVLLSLITLSYVNLIWREKQQKYSTQKNISFIGIILINILLVSFFAQVKIAVYNTIYISEITTRLVFFFYLKTVIILAISILSMYVLHLIIKAKIIEIENLKLKRENTEVQLTSLRNQMNPHFLFNTLNSLSSVIRSGDKSESLLFVDKMSEVYRYILECNDYKLIELDQELKFIEAYMFMMDKRFGKKLKLQIELDEQGRSSLIPPMTLQLLVENAIKHNKITESEPLQITITSLHDQIVVTNNLQKKKSEIGYGIGLANLQNRYRLLLNKELDISEDEHFFRVKLPIILK